MNSIKNTGSRFEVQHVSENHDRLVLDVPKGSINVGQINACLAFIRQANLPVIMYTMNQLFFQAMDDPNFTLSEEDKESLESLSKMLIRCWYAERCPQE